MRILGIDPGIGRMGWALITEQKGEVSMVDADTVETTKNDDFANRLRAIYQATQHILTQYKPDAVAVEELFFASNVKTAFAVGQARGVIILAAAIKQLPVFAYTPLQVKLAVAGYGKADKKQVGQMVKTILKLHTMPKLDDTTDALAVALTHGFSQKIQGLARRA